MRRRRHYPGLFPILHLDHIYYEGHVEVRSVELSRTRQALIASDHLPLVADLRALRKNLDSGISGAIPLSERLRQGIESLRSGAGKWRPGWVLVLVAASVAIAGGWMLGWRFDLVPVTFTALFGLWVFRRYRVRGEKLMKKFAAKLGRMPEVRLVSFQQGKATVVVDRMQAKVYLRVNSLMDGVNAKYFHGRPIRLSVRDDVSREELRRMLDDGRILYLRDDAFEK